MKFRSKLQMSLPTRTNSFLRWSRHLFFIIGILALGYVAFVLVDAKFYQAYQDWRFQQDLEGSNPTVSSSETLHLRSLPPTLADANRANAESLRMAGRGGSPLGRIEIGAIGLEVMILEGIEDETLRRAVGHIPGTSLPGQEGNVAIAGHRDTFFRPLRNIRKDDEITLTTLNGSYRYRVDSIRVVEPEDIAVLDDSDDAVLTLVTCYPFYFVGSAPKRFIVRAHRSPA
jgi:sortase A